MKVKNIFGYIGLILVLGLTLTACTQDEQNSLGDKPYKTENGFYVYPVDFQCAVPGYDDEGKTRAISHNWNRNTSIFARFQSGSNYYYGFLTLGDKGWDLLSTNDFLEMTTTGSVELYYFQEANGDYYCLNLETQCLDVYNNGSFVKNTSIAWNSSSIDFSEGTAVYLTRSGTYSMAGNSGNFTINATLEPGLWRMRFSGSNGTSITMPAADNDILYMSSFNWYGSDNVSFSGEAKDISLKVSNNYTPYIYGQFSSSSSNKITVKNGNDTFTRNLSTSNLPAGKSGCFTLPTSSNYSNAGWTKVATEVSMTLKDMMEKPFGTIDLDFSTATYSKIKTILSSMYTFEENTESNGTGLHYFYIHKTDNPSIEQFSFLGKPLGSLCIRESDRGFYVEYNFYINKSDMPNPYSYMDQITQEFNNINIPMTYELDPYDDYPECLASGYYNIGGYTAGGRSYWVQLYSWSTYYFEIGTSYYTK